MYIMKTARISKITVAASVALAALLFSGIAIAQSAQVQGVIDSRSGATMTVKADSGNVIVLLTDSTDVQEVEGGLHMRKKQMGLTALVPGLSVQVKGSNNAQNQLWPTA